MTAPLKTTTQKQHNNDIAAPPGAAEDKTKTKQRQKMNTKNPTEDATENATELDIEKIAAFYRRSSADLLSALDGQGAGVLWTIPPGSPEALRAAVRQLRRTYATKLRWVRRLRLNSRSEGNIEAVGVYILPEVSQRIFRLDTRREISCTILRDECLTVAEREMAA